MNQETDREASECRALVPTQPPAEQPPRRVNAESRPLSTFLAHLIATSMQAPQTRAQRRGDPADATDRYTGSRPASVRHTGLKLYRSF